jgi:TolB-like protein/Flp pilus assembly protein TadD
MEEPRNFFSELKRRNVYKVAVAYAVIAWLLIQAASILFPTFEAPAWVMKVFVVIVAAGFVVALVIAWAFEMTPEGMKRTEDVGPNEKIPQWSRRKFAALILVITMMAAALLGYQVFRAKPAPHLEGAAPATPNRDGLAGARPSITAKSIAVLPLVNQSGDPAQEYFSDGLSEELINGLGKISELRVIGRNSSFHFKGKTDDSRAIGQALGVANLLEGSVRKAGDRVRIGIQLVNTADGSQSWSETYDRELKDIFAVQAEIARAVADQLRVRLLGGAATISSRPSNENLEAYKAFLQAKFSFDKGSSQAATEALTFLEEALRLDPKYAEAYVLKARTLYFIALPEGPLGRDKFEQARAAVSTALALNPTLPRAHSAMAYIELFADWDFAAADAVLAGVREKDPTVSNTKSVLRVVQGRLEEALALRQDTLTLDPLHAVYHSNAGNILAGLGRLEEAEAAYRKALELQPTMRTAHASLSLIAIRKGDLDTALREAELEAPGLIQTHALALARTARGDKEQADAALQKLIEQAAERSPSRIASVYAARGEAAKMFEWLERAYDVREPVMVAALGAFPSFAPYYSDPRFIALCNKIGMPVPK